MSLPTTLACLAVYTAACAAVTVWYLTRGRGATDTRSRHVH